MISLLFLLLTVLATFARAIGVTPHDEYSSSVGVLGCKIDTNRVAYWPMAVDCNNICVEVSYQGRSVNLLRIDQSGGAYDISYDAWVYLQSGQSATSDPITGGAIEMSYQDVPASNCASLIKTGDGKLPLTAANSMNYVASCMAQAGSWVGSNYALYNIATPTCNLGIDELCTLNLAVSNQPSCPHQLGLQTPLTTDTVWNIQYGTGKAVSATDGSIAPAGVAAAVVPAPVAAAVTSPDYQFEREKISRTMRRWVA